MSMINRVAVGILLSLAFVVPAFAQAQVPGGGGSSDPKQTTFQIVPCNGVASSTNPAIKECDFNSLVEMANRIIKFLLYLSIPFVLAIIMYTAFLYLTANGSEVKLTKAKHMLWYVLVGLFWILISFILVYTVLDKLLDDKIKTDQQGIWNSYFKK
jgi:hypothetical protein